MNNAATILSYSVKHKTAKYCQLSHTIETAAWPSCHSRPQFSFPKMSLRRPDRRAFATDKKTSLHL
ncbi:MAG: hypothetical protein ACOY0R_15555 [Chloroflexota bacterium]